MVDVVDDEVPGDEELDDELSDEEPLDDELDDPEGTEPLRESVR